MKDPMREEWESPSRRIEDMEQRIVEQVDKKQSERKTAAMVFLGALTVIVFLLCTTALLSVYIIWG